MEKHEAKTDDAFLEMVRDRVEKENREGRLDIPLADIRTGEDAAWLMSLLRIDEWLRSLAKSASCGEGIPC